MTHITKLLLLLICGTLFACGSAPNEPEPRKPGTGAVIVTVTGLQNDGGQVLINVFLGPKGFPGDVELAYAALVVKPSQGRAEVRIDKVPAGPIAVSAFHDEDMDKQLDTNVFGIPSEYWGVSRDASGFMGPPSYEDAKLELEANQELRVDVKTG